MNKKRILLSVFSIAAGILSYFFLPETCPEPARRTAVIFVIAALFWALELIPLFATSLLVVVLQIFFLVSPFPAPGMEKVGYTVFLIPFSNPVIMLFMGGFVLAKAFQKYGIDRLIAFHMLRVFGGRPYFVILGFMATTAFLSMWMSNTATAALMIAMIYPLFSGLKERDLFKKAIVLAVAFAATIGGIATPVGTPPNAIAIGMLAERGIQLNFLSWVIMALPLAVVLILITSGLIYFFFPSQSKHFSFHVPDTLELGREGKAVISIGLLTVFLWLSSRWHRMPEAVVALLAVVLLTVFSLIDRKDFSSIEWDILILMWGGLALGEAMEKTGFAAWLVGLPMFNHQGHVLIVVLCITSAVLSTFISNTATVNLLVPIALSIPGQEPIMIATVIALASSFDLALPMATPPMAIAYGTQQVRVADMLKVGIFFTVIANVLLLIGFEFFIGKMVTG